MGITAAPVLDLDAIVPDRSTILIRTESKPEGVLWEMRRRNELSIEQLYTVQSIGEKLGEIGDVKNINAQNSKIVDESLDEMLRIVFVLQLDDDTYGSLDVTKKTSIIQAFNTVCLQMPSPAKQTSTATRTRTRKTTKQIGES